jgi:hypothetical protein
MAHELPSPSHSIAPLFIQARPRCVTWADLSECENRNTVFPRAPSYGHALHGTLVYAAHDPRRHGPTAPLIPDLVRHVRCLGSQMSVSPTCTSPPSYSRCVRAPPAPESYFLSRSVRLGPVVPFSGGEVAPSTSHQLRGLLPHAVDCAMVPLPLRTSCLLGSFSGVRAGEAV